MTLREYIIFWQETYDRYQSRSTTYAAHNYVFKNHILPGLGDVLLSELTSEMVGEFLEERKRFGNHRPGSSGLGEETMRHIHRLLQQCLDQAIRDGFLTENPAKAFCYRKSTTVKANIMTPLETEDYLDAAERLGYLPMFMLALTTGLRQGELIALKWSDLDIENRTLTIAENRAVVRRELVEYGSQTRSIKLTPEVVDLLIMEHSKHPSSPLMFMHPATQRPYSPQMVRRMHNEIIKEAGIDHIRYVDLRHTCAILALKNGVDTKELAQMLGHYRPTITRQNYRVSHTLNYYRKKLRFMGKSTEAADVARFQQKTEYPYRTSFVGAAISSLPAVEKKVIVGIMGADLELKTDQSVFYVHGADLMSLTHQVFERCIK